MQKIIKFHSAECLNLLCYQSEVNFHLLHFEKSGTKGSAITACRGKFILHLLCSIFLTLFLHSLYAGGFSISPMSLNLSPKKTIGSISFKNNSDNTLIVKTELFSVKRQLGKDIESIVSDDLIISPPIATISPNTTQILRVGMLEPNFSTSERVFHLYLTPMPVQVALTENKYISFLYRVAIPIYIRPLNLISKIVTNEVFNKNGELVITLHNEGNSHVNVENVIVKRKGSREILGEQQKIYTKIYPSEFAQIKIASRKSFKNNKHDIQVALVDSE